MTDRKKNQGNLFADFIQGDFNVDINKDVKQFPVANYSKFQGSAVDAFEYFFIKKTWNPITNETNKYIEFKNATGIR